MLNAIIRQSLANRFLVVFLSGVLLLGGIYTGGHLPVEVLPDLTKPTVTIIAECPGLAPEEVEALVTVPVESTLMGVSGLTRLRSISDVALSLSYVEFEWGTDILQARRLVQERLQIIQNDLPEAVTPIMTPVASLMGEIMLVGLSNPPGSLAPAELRWMADWTIRRRFQSIPGVAEVLCQGGGVKQVHIQPDPRKMRAYQISLEQLRNAAVQAASNTTGGFLADGDQEIMVRNLAMTTDVEELGQTVVRHDGDRPVYLRDVANLTWDVQPMRGDAAVDGNPGVILSITKSPGYDTIRLSEKVEEAIAELQMGLPDGVQLKALFRQSDFIHLAMGNLREAVELGGIMVCLVLAVFLMNWRTTVITLTAIPLSFATTALIFYWMGVSVNSMTLGGLAVAIGMVVDDAIIDVENVFRRLRENTVLPSSKPRLEVIASASAEIRNSIFYATLIIILSFIPLLGLSGVEGRLFTPIALATIISMSASFLISLTVIPVLSFYLLDPTSKESERDPWVIRWVKALFRRTWLRLALDYPVIILLAAGLTLAAAGVIYPLMGRDFLPKFREETIIIAMSAAPGTSLKTTSFLAGAVEKQLQEVPEIRSIGRRVGRAERGDHVVPVSTAEFDIDFHKGGRPRTSVMEDIRARMKTIPGIFTAITSPLGDRIGHMLSGVSAPVAIKIFGNDLDQIRQVGTQIRDIAGTIPGLESARLEQQAPIQQWRIQIDRTKAAAFGITPGQLNQQLSTLLGGEKVAEIYDGPRTIDLVIKLDDAWRNDSSLLEQVYFSTLNGGSVPLKSIAEIRSATGPNVIHRENTMRRFVVSIHPTSQGVTELIRQLETQIHDKIHLPPGMHISFEGEFKARESASRRIGILAVGIFAIIGFLLVQYFRSVFFSLQVLADTALALMGGVILTYVMLGNVSVSTLVGFVAVAGIGARNSVMLISHYLYLMKYEGREFSRDMIEAATLERLIPVLMTAITAGIALIPLLLAADKPGKEILSPIAVVIIGGLVTSTLLGLGVTPAIFFHFGRRAAVRTTQNES